MFKTVLRVLSLLLSLAAISAQPGKPEEPRDIGARLELFVDDYLIESMKDLELKLHSPRPAGKVLILDRPWEGVTSAYISIFKDGDLYRMYYRGSSSKGYTVRSLLEPGERVIPEHPDVTCYAESRDGRNWIKPSLGLFEFQGSRENNIVWAAPSSQCFMAFRDANPTAPREQRYKALAISTESSPKRVIGLVSPDGLHWRPIRKEAILIQEETDSGADHAFWDTEQERYVAYLRAFRPPPLKTIRLVARSTSSDFLNWSELEFLKTGDAPVEHFYTSGAIPYFRAPHVYLAFPRRFLPWRTLELYKDNRGSGVSDVMFLSSRDGLHWKRTFMEAFIRPGRNIRSWIHRANTPASGLVPTGEDEVSLYLQRHYTFPSIHVERMALRTDGFVSVHAGYFGGEMVTKPLLFQGDNLVLNFATSAAGSIRVEIQNAQGNPLPGFALEESTLIWGDEIEHTVRWERTHPRATSEKPLTRIAGKPIRLRFVMKDADLYSLRFR